MGVTSLPASRCHQQVSLKPQALVNLSTVEMSGTERGVVMATLLVLTVTVMVVAVGGS